MSSKFTQLDYIIFAISLIIPTIIGFVFACTGDKQKTSKELLLGGQTLHPVPVALSILASLLNAVFIIGTPNEVYYNGAVYAYIGIAWIFVVLVTALVVVPMFSKMKVVSAYQYLEKRFNKHVRTIASAIFSLAMVLFLSVVIYAPAFAFNKVTGLPMWLAVSVCGLVCTKYCVLGGIKAIVWTDAFQMIIVVISLLVMTAIGSERIGGASVVWNIVKDGQRNNFNIFDPNPTVRHTFWTQTLGQFFLWMSLFSTNQMMIQRYQTMATVRQTQISLLVVLVTAELTLALVVSLGLVMYAYYYQCHPQEVAKRNGDMMMPRLMMDLMGDMHGMPGLFTASVFAAALSSVSSAINSLSAVFLEDFIKPGYQACGKKLTPVTAGWITRGMALFFGTLTIILSSFVAPKMGHVIIQIPGTIWGTVGGPMLGIFVLGFFVPCCNSWGAGSALVSSVAIMLWISVGSILRQQHPPPLPLGTNCTNVSYVTSNITTSAAVDSFFASDLKPVAERSTLDQIYSVSYVWYSLIGCVVAIIVGILVSWISEGIAQGYNIEEQVHHGTIYRCGSRCGCCQPSADQQTNVNGSVPAEQTAQMMDNDLQHPEKCTGEKNGIENLAFQKDQTINDDDMLTHL